MLASLELRGVELDRIRLMNKDSLEMSHDDHTLVARVAGEEASRHDGVVVVHGTDRLAVTGERVVAMWPYELRNTDALQNLTEALIAAQLLAPGVYAVMHAQVLAFPGVVKDPALGSFVKP